MDSISIVGPGRVGLALARAFRSRGVPVEAVYGRRAGGAYPLVDEASLIRGKTVILTVPDASIPGVVQSLKPKLEEDAVVLHTSGPLTSKILTPLRPRAVASMHPLVSVNGRSVSENLFAGAFFGIEGDSAGTKTAERLAASIGAHTLRISPELKPLYHAAAVAACGHVTALLNVAASMMVRAGFGKDEAWRALEPLVASTLSNISDSNFSEALTGTFARLDSQGFERQLEAFAGRLSTTERDVYIALAAHSLQLAAEAGASHTQIQAMEELVRMARTNAGVINSENDGIRD